jgi:hypothetical protein
MATMPLRGLNVGYGETAQTKAGGNCPLGGMGEGHDVASDISAIFGAADTSFTQKLPAMRPFIRRAVPVLMPLF